MQRARRLASTAVVAVLAVSGLSACRAEPDVAAYLGANGSITEAEVDNVYDQAFDALTAARDQAQQAGQAAGASAEAVPPVQMPFKQHDVLNALLTVKLLEKAAAAHSVQAAAKPTVEEVAQSARLAPEWEYTKLYTRAEQLRNALLPTVTPAQVADADLRAVYDRLAAAGATNLPPFEQFKTQLSEGDRTVLQQSFGLRDELVKIIADEDIKPNPRYGDQRIAVFEISGGVRLVEVSLPGSQAPFVTDLS